MGSELGVFMTFGQPKLLVNYSGLLVILGQLVFGPGGWGGVVWCRVSGLGLCWVLSVGWSLVISDGVSVGWLLWLF